MQGETKTHDTSPCDFFGQLDPTPRRTSKPALTSSCPRHPRPGPAATPSTRSRRQTPRTRGSNCHGRATTETRVTSGSRTPRCSISSAAGWTRGSSRTNAWETLTRRTASPSSPNRNLNRHRRQTGTGSDSSDEEDDSYVPDMRPRWVSVVSQLDVLDLMVQDPDLLGTFPRTATMESLGLTRGVFSVAAVTSDFSVAGCFALMHNLKVSGVAVLDRHGRFMIGSISASDVRRVTCANDLADALMSTVGEFLRDRVWSKIPGRENQRHARPILVVDKTHNLPVSLLTQLLLHRTAHKAHRTMRAENRVAIMSLLLTL